jgi:hypothetical protein
MTRLSTLRIYLPVDDELRPLLTILKQIVFKFFESLVLRTSVNICAYITHFNGTTGKGTQFSSTAGSTSRVEFAISTRRADMTYLVYDKQFSLVSES